MRILLASNYQWPHVGGIEVVAAHLKKCWERDGHSVTWVTSDVPRGALPSTADNIRLRAFNGFEDRFQINVPLVSPLAYFRLARLMKTHDAVSVHSLAPGITALTIRAALACRKPLTVTQQVGVIPLRSRFLTALQERLVLANARSCARNGAWVTFAGKTVHDWFLAEGRLDPRVVCMTPNAYDKDMFHLFDGEARERERRGLDLPADKLKVLFVARFIDKKGLPLIRGAAQACPDIRFTLVGEGVIKPTEWGLPNVVVVPPTPPLALRSYYAAHDLLILPSVGEGWPLVICEAMACGTPCLVSRETFVNYGRDESMFMVAENSVSALVEALKRAQEGRVALLRERAKVAGYARESWDWMRTARQFLDLFGHRPPAG